MRFIVPCLLSVAVLAVPSTAKAVLLLDFPEITATPGGFISAPISIVGDGTLDELRIGIGIDQVAGSLSNSLVVSDVDPNSDSNSIWTNASRSFAAPGVGYPTATVTITNSGSLDTNPAGTAATITFDTTNAKVGDVFLVNLNELGLTKAFLDGGDGPAIQTTNGSITMVPEPSSFIYLGLVGIGYFGFRRLRRGKK